MSHYKNLILENHNKKTFLSLLIQGYPWISHTGSSGYPGIFRYKLGYGRVSLFHVLSQTPSHSLIGLGAEFRARVGRRLSSAIDLTR